MKELLNKNNVIITQAGDYITRELERILTNTARKVKALIIVVADYDGEVKEIFVARKYAGNLTESILYSIKAGADVYIYSTAEYLNYAADIAFKLYKLDDEVMVSLNGKIVDDEAGKEFGKLCCGM